MPTGAPHLVPANAVGPDLAGIGLNGDALESPFYPDGAAMGFYGRLFSLSQAIAGVAPGTSGTTTTPALTIYHATKPIFIWAVRVGYVSGTIGKGHLSLARQTGVATAPSGGTAISVLPVNGAGATSTLAGTGHTVTALAAANDRYPICDLNATLATAPAADTGAVTQPIWHYVGAWIAALEVASIYGIAAAGSTPLIRLSALIIDDPRVTALAAAS